MIISTPSSLGGCEPSERSSPRRTLTQKAEWRPEITAVGMSPPTRKPISPASPRGFFFCHAGHMDFVMLPIKGDITEKNWTGCATRSLSVSDFALKRVMSGLAD